MRRATASASLEISAETMIAARRPKGGIADAPGYGFGFGRVLGRNDDRCEPAERRHGRFAPRLGLGGVEAGCVAFDQRGDDRGVGVVRLDKDAARLVAAAGAAGDLLDLLEAPLGGPEVAAR